jgi:ABC-2 type transport system ATP-binding protein
MPEATVSTELAIKVNGLTKHYGDLLAVDHINFEVKRGETFGFLGPNGAGKTTTIRMLTGIIKKDSGEASILGYPAGSIRAKQLSGVMPELSNAYMDLTAWGNLMLMAEIYRVPSKMGKERSENLLQQLGIYERKDSLASTFSMGMRKLLVLAMALLSDPQLLFLDEPTSGLDVQSVRFMRSLLRNLRQEGKTIFLTTHHMDEASEMCSRVDIINRG